MRLLRLGTSNDFIEGVAPEHRAANVSARILGDATGEPVEMTIKRFWPTEAFLPALDRWLGEFDPEMVLFIIPSYPICYESVPLHVERRLGRIGGALNRRSQAAASSRFGSTRVFHLGRRFLMRTIGGVPLLTVPEMMEYVDGALRLILRHEGVIPIVRGPHNPFGVESEAARRRSEARRQHLNRELLALCAKLHVHAEVWSERPKDVEDPSRFLGDLVHGNESDAKRVGEFEGLAMVRAWQAGHGGVSAR